MIPWFHGIAGAASVLLKRKEFKVAYNNPELFSGCPIGNTSRQSNEQ